jgi:hypothetical protein
MPPCSPTLDSLGKWDRGSRRFPSPDCGPPASLGGMKKLLILAVLVALGIVAAQKLRSS